MQNQVIYFPQLVAQHQSASWNWLSGIQTKLRSDKLLISDSLLYLIGQGGDFYYRSYHATGIWNASGRSPHWLNNVCASLGIYLEDFFHDNFEVIQRDLGKNLRMRWLPMLEISRGVLQGDPGEHDQEEILWVPVVGVLADNTGWVVLHPDKSDCVPIQFERLREFGKLPSKCPLREGKLGWRWFMLTSPSFMKPVFPDLEWSIRVALQNAVHRFLYLPRMPTSMGMTGRQALRAWIDDLHELSATESHVSTNLQIKHFQQLANGEMGHSWGRDKLADGMREITRLLGTEWESVAYLYQHLGIRWQEFTDTLLSVGKSGATALYEAGDLLACIEWEETQVIELISRLLAGRKLGQGGVGWV